MWSPNEYNLYTVGTIKSNYNLSKSPEIARKIAKILQNGQDFIISTRKIRKIRQESGLTQEDFGAKFGVTRGCVAKWETGARECAGIYAFVIGNYYFEDSDDDEFDDEDDEDCEL